MQRRRRRTYFYGVLRILPLSVSHSRNYSEAHIFFWKRLRERIFPRLYLGLAQVANGITRRTEKLSSESGENSAPYCDVLRFRVGSETF